MRNRFSQSPELPLAFFDLTPSRDDSRNVGDVNEDSIDIAVDIPGRGINEVDIYIVENRFAANRLAAMDPKE